MGKEAASLFIGVRTDTAAARRQLKALFADASKEIKTTARDINATAQQQASLGLKLARVSTEEARTAKTLAGALKQQAEARRIVAKAALDQAKAQRDAEKAEMRRQPASAGSRFMNAVTTSRFQLPGTGGAIMPLIGQTLKGGVAGGAGLAATAFASVASQQAKEAVTLAADLEQALDVLRAQTKATDAQMAKLGQTARDLGADVTLPATNSVDAINAMQALSEKSLSLEDSMNGAKGALQLAAAKSLEVRDAALITGNALNAFSMQGSQATLVADMLTAASQAGGTEIHALSDAIAQGGASASQAGFSLKEFLADMAQMAQKGIQGSDSATSMKNAIRALQAPTKQASDKMREIGLAVYDANGNFVKHDELVRRVTKALKGKSDADRNAAVSVIFGSDGMRYANVVLSQGITKNQQFAKKVYDTGRAAEVNTAKMKGFNGAVEGLNSALDSFKEEAAAPFLNYLTKIATSATHGIEKLRDLRTEIANHGTVATPTDYINSKAKPTTAEDARMAAGKRRIQLRVVNEEIAFARTGSIPAPTGLQNNLSDVERSQIIGNLQMKYGFPRDHNIQAMQATAAKLRSEIQSLDKRAEGLPSEAEKKKPKPKPTPSGGGGPKQTVYADYDRNAITADDLEREFKRLNDQYQKAPTRALEDRLLGLSGRIAAAEMGVARRGLAGKENDSEAMTRFKTEEGQIGGRRSDRDKDIADTLKNFLDKNARESKGDRLRATTMAEERTLRTLENSFKGAIDNLGEAKTKDEIETARTTLVEAMKVLNRQRGVVASAKNAENVFNDPNSAVTKQSYLDAQAAQRQDYKDDSKQIREKVKDAYDRLEDAAQKEAEAQADAAKNAQEWAKDAIEAKQKWLEEEYEGLEFLRDISRNFQEAEQYTGTMLKNRAEVLTDEFLNSMFSDPAAFTKYALATMRLNQVGSKLHDENIDKYLARTPSTDEVAQGEEEMVTFRTRDGGEITVPRSEAGSYLRDDRVHENYGAYRRGVRTTLQDGASQLAESAVSGNLDLDGAKSIAMGVGKDIAGNASKELIRQISTGEINDTFKSLTEALGGNIKGLDMSGKSLLAVGMGLYGLANILGAGGKRKQTNSIIGAAVGFGLGSVIPGVGNLAGAAFGAGLGGFFAEGGVPPVGRLSVLGEHEPEWFVPREPGNVLNQRQVAAVVDKAGGRGKGYEVNIYGPVRDYNDVLYALRQRDRMRELESLTD